MKNNRFNIQATARVIKSTVTNISKVYKSPTGEEELTVEFGDDGYVDISDKDEGGLEISDAQGRWLADILHERFGGGPKEDFEQERLLFFTGVVEEKTVKDMQRELLKLAHREIHLPIEKRGAIKIFINSPGGYVHDGLALMSTIEYVRGMGVPVVGVIQGMAASMATVIIQACTARMVHRHARCMVHEISGFSFGKLGEMNVDLKESKETNDMLAEIYASRNTAELTDPAYWIEFMSNYDKYMSAERFVEMGLADGVYNALEDGQIEVQFYPEGYDPDAEDDEESDGEVAEEASNENTEEENLSTDSATELSTI